jgi:hypothetical protein
MVRRARLNPAGLQWEQFVVGERDGRAVGVAQVRRYSDGTENSPFLPRFPRLKRLNHHPTPARPVSGAQPGDGHHLEPSRAALAR